MANVVEILIAGRKQFEAAGTHLTGISADLAALGHEFQERARQAAVKRRERLRFMRLAVGLDAALERGRNGTQGR